MNTVESTALVGPYGKEDTCAKFVIDELTYPYKFANVANPGTTYTLSLWAKSDENGSISTGDKVFSVTPNWARYTATFTASFDDVYIYFVVPGTYYIYHAQLETGTKATDWTPSPEDVDQDIATAQSAADAAKDAADAGTILAETANSLIEQLKDSIKMIVTKTVTVYDEEGNIIDVREESAMEQTEDGWSFNMTQTEEKLGSIQNDLDSLGDKYVDTAGLVDSLNQAVTDIGLKTAYVNIITTDDGQPCIELGATDSNFKVIITNTEIRFMEGSNKPAYINNQSMFIKKAVIEEELQQGEFVWKARSNGNLGLIWKGGSA